MMTVFTIVYNGYGRFLMQWNDYMDKQTIPIKKMVVLGKDHGADIEFLEKNNIKYIECDSTIMGVLRNAGLKHVDTEWWFYFASDDELLSHACEEIMNTDADAVSIRFDVIGVNGLLERNQNSPHLQSDRDVRNWKSTKWGGYTAVRGNHDLRYNEEVEVPNLTLHFELYRRSLKVVKSKSVLVVHHRWSESHHFKSEKDGSRKKSIKDINRIAKQLLEEKEKTLMSKRYLVEANKEWKNRKIKCTDLEPHRVPEAGEQWEVDGIRLETLQGKNAYNQLFVNVISEIIPIEVTEEGAKKLEEIREYDLKLSEKENFEQLKQEFELKTKQPVKRKSTKKIAENNQSKE